MSVSENYTPMYSIPKLPSGNMAALPYAFRMGLEKKGFSVRLKEARSAKGMSGVNLGAQLAVSKATVSHWENGRYEPNLGQLDALCNVLGVTADWLLERESTPLSAEALAEARAFEALPADERRKWRAMRLTMFSTA